jgi:hypothetical protein
LEGYTVANQKVIMSFRIDESLRAAAHAMADEEKRTTSNFMEVLIQREQERKNGNEITLDTVLMEVRRIWDFLLLQSKPKPKDSSDTDKKQRVIEELLALELPETLSHETWLRWIVYRKKQRYHWDVETAKGLLDRWEEAENDGSSLDELVELAMQRGWKDAVYDKPNQEATKTHWYQEGIR